MPVFRVKMEATVDNVELEGVIQLYADDEDDAKRRAEELVLDGKLATKDRIIKFQMENRVTSCKAVSVEEIFDPEK